MSTASAIVLGCGPSGGVPSVSGYWGKCQPFHPCNRRTRTSLALETNRGVWLIDASPDLRFQCLREGITRIQGILLTHAHADHVNGLDDVKGWGRKKPVLVYGDSGTLESIRQRFSYMFDHAHAHHHPFLTLHSFDIGDVLPLPFARVETFEQDHRYVHSVGYRIGSMAYTTDAWRLDDRALDILKGIDTWFVDCLDWNPCPTHAHWGKVQDWLKVVQPQRTILIHMGTNMDYTEMKSQLPAGVEPAYDGMRVEVKLS